MAGINRVTLIGNLGQDPEIRPLDNGRNRATFSLATSRRYKNRDGELVSKTDWHNIVLWSPLAEIAEKYLRKGKQVYIEGRITSRSYETQDGTKRYITEIVAQQLQLLGRKDEEAMSMGDEAPKTTLSTESTSAADDLPF